MWLNQSERLVTFKTCHCLREHWNCLGQRGLRISCEVRIERKEYVQMLAQERKGIVGIFLNNVCGELEVHVRLMFIQTRAVP